MQQIPESFYMKEERGGEFIDARKKRIWAASLTLVMELDRICKKHDIPYIMDYGTLLGAVRHKGFIPWDDDCDFSMLRPDYQRFIEIAPKELSPPFSFALNYDTNTFCKIRDDRTSAIEFPWYPPEISQGIGIDIFPVDDIGEGPAFDEIHRVQYELLLLACDPSMLAEEVKMGRPLHLSSEKIMTLSAAGPDAVLEEFRRFSAEHTYGEPLVANIQNWLGNGHAYKRQWYADRILLPFEFLDLPAPAAWDELLRADYNEYLIPARWADRHYEFASDPDHPWTEYYPGGKFCDKELYEALRQMGRITWDF